MNRRDLMKRFSLAAAAAGKPRLRTGICAYSFRDELAKKTMQYGDLIRLASDLGVDGLDLTVYWFPNTSSDYLVSLRRLAYSLAVDIYSISIRTNLCRATPEAQDGEVERLKPWLDVAARLGARHIRVFGGAPPQGTADEQAVPWVVETLGKCAAIAGARGIVLGVEDDGALTEDAERLVRIVKQANSPWVGINVDVGNFKIDGYRQTAMCLPYSVNLHLKTEVRVDGKSQPLDWDRLFRLVAPVYRGYIALEYESSGQPRTAVPEVIGQLQAAVRKYAPAGA